MALYRENRQDHRRLLANTICPEDSRYRSDLPQYVRGVLIPATGNIQANKVVVDRPWTTFIHGGNRAPALMRALCDGPNIGLTTGYVKSELELKGQVKTREKIEEYALLCTYPEFSLICYFTRRRAKSGGGVRTRNGKRSPLKICSRKLVVFVIVC